MARSDNEKDFPELYGPSRRARLVRLIVASVLLVILIIFLIWLLFFKGSPTAPSDNPSGVTEITNNGSSQKRNNSSKNGNGNSNPSTGNSGTNNSNGSGGAENQGSSNSRSTQKNGKLTETGPGDVVAVFIGSVVVASIGFKLFAVKRARS
jgi:cytoskeletal protein RodZ